MAKSLIERIGSRACATAERLFPDPFVIAVFLTFVTAAIALALTDSAPLDLVQHWMGDSDPKREYGFSGRWILTFALQMALMLVTGHALATAPIVARGIDWLARKPRSTGSAAALVATATIIASFLNWALALIFGALLARAVGQEARRQGRRFHYPLIGAAGYMGMMTWHGGFSGSAPLKVTKVSDIAGLVGEEKAAQIGAIPLEQTILSPLNLVVSLGLLVLVPLLLYWLAPKNPEDAQEMEGPLSQEPDTKEQEASAALTFGQRLNESRLLALLFVLGIGVYLVRFYGSGGLSRLDPNTLNLTLLALGLLLHQTPGRYVHAVEKAAGASAGIILQFPLYAGIMGLMQGSGLVQVLAGYANTLATETTLPVITFLSAGLVNVFIPSGGGQWAVQGPIVVEAALSLGVPVEKVVMALAYGDEWTNMLQPFWALPLLGITGLRAGQVMGYTMMIMMIVLPLYIIPLLLF